MQTQRIRPTPSAMDPPNANRSSATTTNRTSFDAFLRDPSFPTRCLFVLCALILRASSCDAVANNLHMYDGISTAEILADDVFFEIVEPEELQYTYRLRLARDFGVPFGSEFKLNSQVLVPADPANACDIINNKDDIDGTILLVERGGCPFIQKALLAEAHGALAVIVTDTNATSEDAEHYIEMIHDKASGDVDIPVAYLLGKNGQMIQNTLRRLRLDYAIINIPMNLTFTPPHKINHPPWVGW